MLDRVFKLIARHPGLHQRVRPLGRPVYRWLQSLNYRRVVRKTGWHFPKTMAPATGLAMAQDSYEPATTLLIQSQLRPDDIFIDIGANVGYFTRIAAKQVTQTGRVFAFEPEPGNYACLAANVAHMPNVIPLSLGVSNKNMVMQLWRSTHSACHSLVQTDAFLDGTYALIPTITMETFHAEYLTNKSIALIKIDVEGAETQVLQGLEGLFKRELVGAIIVEYAPRILERSGQDILDLWNLLAPYFHLTPIADDRLAQRHAGPIGSREDFQCVAKHLLEQPGAININLWCQKISPG